MELHDLLEKLSVRNGVPGFEEEVASLIREAFSPLVDETRIDNLGNLIFLKKGSSPPGLRVIYCAHMDEIGLIVTRVEESGFLRFASLGGFDPRTLPGQVVTVYGKEKIRGVIGFKPPQLVADEDKNKSPKLEDLFIDPGLDARVVQELVSPGSVVAINRSFVSLFNNCRSGKALDDRAGVAALWQCLKELNRLNHKPDLFLAVTVQEEVGVRGAVVATYGLAPDLGIAVDVCHGDFPGSQEHEVSILGKGPVITAGPNIHPHLYKKLLATAKEYNLPYQKDVSPGPTGTDARAIQISGEGVPTGLVSIPLRYMHTSVEVVNLDDIKIAGRLLAYFLAGLDKAFVEGLTCL